MMFGEQRFNQFGTVSTLSRKSAFLVNPDQARKARDVCGHDSCQPALVSLRHEAILTAVV